MQHWTLYQSVVQQKQHKHHDIVGEGQPQDTTEGEEEHYISNQVQFRWN